MFETSFIIGLATLAIIKAAPLVYGALGGLVGEHSGVINIGIEGMMLIGSFTAFMGSALFNQWTGGAYPPGVALLIGLAAGMFFGGLVAALHAVLSIHYQIDQVISGTVINLLAVGLTNFIANVYIDPTHLAGVGVFPKVTIPLLSKIPIIGPVLFDQQPLVYLMFILVAFLQYALFHTPWGLRLRSVGEHPRAADTVGIDVNRTRYAAVILGGVLSGMGGAFLVLESVGRFQKLMTAGRGFIALAVMIFGRWTPIGSLGAALLFGFAEALGVRLQFGDINHIFALMVIAAVTLLVIGSIWLAGKLLTQEPFGRAYTASLAFIISGAALLVLALTANFPQVKVPIEYLGLLPYILTMLVLAGVGKKAVGPAAVGRPYEKQ